ncbi:TetR/AcrR family transcriptional regulator [Leptospira kanakyensis]|uniref:TetR/AcrR family transcriptional regulator n=1 Tax=Leptospira kanakyensis TaxID=2484968 RepID=A0A6N4QM99_9LEPT|nr:TetR/AcrR family transcriptional regulator [Leptospira kanakyensis]MCW7470767.1 TetR/AcrR family transcriptional regulator [Leptospira kanakyensis]MCW7483170.1 TetR/AcrR family transcriptional regulator [Leptospira kanakyensis]TGK54883.1 TetR/AcrR family transcriptional regulator [Leptospira kanakyensis]TGK56397.1 TetR/AcrR family transcriptional regulator [Leptospira kanakyensis]TGK75833.1 TetR/AcrR family transcriptional regulator [Leptospira kanakyensis]
MKQKIIQTALKICEKDGYESFSMRKLATKLELDPMAIYHYFDNKEELTKAMVGQVFDRFEQKTLIKFKNPNLALKKYLLGYWNLFIEYPGLSLYLIKNSYDGFPSVVSLNQNLQNLFHAVCPSHHDTEKILHIIIDFIHGNALAVSQIPKGKLKNSKISQNQREFESSLAYLLDQFIRA